MSRDGPAYPPSRRMVTMKHPRLLLPALLSLALLAAGRAPAPGQAPGEKKAGLWWFGPPAKVKEDKLPLCGLPPAKLLPNLCLLKYRITTSSPECQAFFDQGLGFLYSYVWMEAARSFETAVRHDPDCATAWWALSRALERYGKSNQIEALKKAKDLLP